VKALDHYQKALECNPMNPDNYIYLALNFEKIGQIEKGVETLERAIYQLGSSLDLHLHCAKLYYRSSRLKRCRDHLNRVMDMSPFHEEAQEIRELIIDSS
jgi:tetratricopeptide (TPR) repeat protein